MQKTKYDWDAFALSLGNMVIAIVVALLLCSEFHIGWSGGVAFYILVFNFMRIVDEVASE